MARTACPIVPSEEERITWARRVRARTSAQQVAQRAAIVLQAAAGTANTAIAAALGLSSPTVGHRRTRVAAQRLAGLRDRPHNSGHLTIEACPTSQFEQQLRAIRA